MSREPVLEVDKKQQISKEKKKQEALINPKIKQLKVVQHCTTVDRFECVYSTGSLLLSHSSRNQEQLLTSLGTHPVNGEAFPPSN